MTRLFAAVAAIAVFVPELPAQEKPAKSDYPHVFLKNDKLKVKVYLPDAEKGFYRGTRFDWAGVCGEVEFAGHKVFGPWKDTHDPTNHDDIVGPCEEFGYEKPLGYDEAKPGETFLKIGVGDLEKPDDKPYQFSRKYKIVKPVSWTAGVIDPKDPRGVGFRAEVKGPNGYAYRYDKRVIVEPAKARFMIVHTLTNAGTKPIATDVYNHNFFNVDADPVGPNYSFRFAFDPKTKDLRGRFGELVEAGDKQLRFKGKLADGFVMAGVTGYDREVPIDQEFVMRHAASGVGVQVWHTEPFAKFNVWGIKTTICPEPFHQFTIKPGENQIWAITYEFAEEPAKK